MSDGMRRELMYLSSYATNRYFIPNWGNISMRSLQNKSLNVHLATNIDFLITHIPPEGILDDGRGSIPLLMEVYQHHPHFHVFGHAHSCGNKSKGGVYTEYYNVSQFDDLRK